MTSMTEAAQTEAVRPFAPAAAAILGGAAGCFVLGLLTTLAEANASIKDWLEFNTRVGPLSGKTIIAAAAFVVCWAVFALVLRGKNPAFRTVTWVAAVLIGVGLVMTFPTFFQAFA